jgi:hypothetical protein
MTINVGFMVDKVALGQVLSEYCHFPFQSSFHQLLQNHYHLTSGAGAIVPSGLCLSPLIIIIIIIIVI